MPDELNPTPIPPQTENPPPTLIGTAGKEGETPPVIDPSKGEKPPVEPTPEQKAAEEKAAAEKAEADKKAAEAAAKNDTKANPFKVEEIVLPEGFEPDATTQGEFVGLVNKYGIPRDAVADLIALQGRATQALSAKDSEAWNDLQTKWRTEIETHAEIGGSKLQDTTTNIALFLNKWGNDEVRAAMDLTGAGNHPAIAAMLAKAGAELREGAAVSGQPRQPVSDDPASRLYPNQGKT